ncbi:MAG: enolase C-terminal domain-like protein, partial [Leadbetterella sp.]
MALKASYCKHTLNFRFDAGTSRGVLKNKDSYFIKLWNETEPEIFGIGEASPLLSLSIEYESIAQAVKDLCLEINSKSYILSQKLEILNIIRNNSSLFFALETAFLDLENGGKRRIYSTDFYLNQKPISINGLVWMGEKDFMFSQIKEKIVSGYSTIKLKVGAIQLEEELSLLAYIRSQFSENDITIRLDANGAFSTLNGLEILKRFSDYGIHSIEQPIKQGQWDHMANLI